MWWGPSGLHFWLVFKLALILLPPVPLPPSLLLAGSKANVSGAVLPGDFREVLQRRLGELERQLLRKGSRAGGREVPAPQRDLSSHEDRERPGPCCRGHQAGRGERQAGVSAAPGDPSISRLSTPAPHHHHPRPAPNPSNLTYLAAV